MVRSRADLRLDALGSGSDYTPFLQHLGIAALNLGYGGEDEYGQYHSIYDSFDHYTRFMDPTFDYGIALAQTVGRAVLRLANAEVLPFDFDGFADNLATYLREVEELADTMRKETEERNRRIEDGTYQASFDPTKTFVVPQPKEPVPYLNFAPLHNALARLQQRVKEYQAARESIAAKGPLPARVQEQLDRSLAQSERSLTREQGLPGRAWFVHQIYAPGFYTGYGVKTLPEVREAIEQRKWDQVESAVERVAETLDRFTEQVGSATALLQAS
jgi:N-acetylated-alpha-linked acidic dipeptidase